MRDNAINKVDMITGLHKESSLIVIVIICPTSLKYEIWWWLDKKPYSICMGLGPCYDAVSGFIDIDSKTILEKGTIIDMNIWIVM